MSKKFKMEDVLNKRFGKLTTIGIVPYEARGILCRCDCGNETIVKAASYLRSGNTTSCGCYGKATRTTHGLSRSIAYRRYAGMIARCENPNYIGYPNYGGRGIKICRRWRESFENFFEDMGHPTNEKMTLDRIDTDGDYEKSNCRWETHANQQLNKTNNVRIKAFGKTQTLAEWAREYGFEFGELRRRMLKMPPEEALKKK